MSGISIERLKELLHYSQDTGDFQWKVDRNNRTKAGSRAGSANGAYWYIYLDGKSIPAHRIAWAIGHGEWPKQHIDHINGDPGDNRLSNLRDVSRSENLQNQRKAHANSSTGYLGVSRKRGKFVAAIQRGSESRHIGTFETAEQAFEAYKQAKADAHGVLL